MQPFVYCVSDEKGLLTCITLKGDMDPVGE